MSKDKLFDTSKSFWSVHSGFKSISPFKEYNKKKDSSRVMWAIALIYDYESDLFNAPLMDRIDIVETDFLDEVGFFDNNRELTDPLIKKYSYLQRTSEMRYLEVWNKKVDEIVDVIKEEKMTLENIKDFTAILLKVDDLLDQRDKISTRMAKRREKEGDSALIGGGILSLMEEGKI